MTGGQEAPGAPPSSGFPIPCLAPPPGRSSLRSGQMAASLSGLTFVLSHLSGNSDSLSPASAKVPEGSLLDSRPPACGREDAVFWRFYSLVPCSGPGLGTGTGGSRRKIQELPPGTGEDRARWGRQTSCGCCDKLPKKKWPETTHTYYLAVWSPEVLKSRCQGCVPSGGSKEKTLSLRFPALETACIPWFVAPSSSLAHSLSPSLSPPLLRWPCKIPLAGRLKP